MEPTKKSGYRPHPISEEAFAELAEKYGMAIEKVRELAGELRVGRPRLEMHLIVLTLEARKRKFFAHLPRA